MPTKRGEALSPVPQFEFGQSSHVSKSAATIHIATTDAKAAAIAYTLIETAKLNDVDPNAWLADILARITDYKITKVDDLLPWRWNG